MIEKSSKKTATKTKTAQMESTTHSTNKPQHPMRRRRVLIIKSLFRQEEDDSQQTLRSIEDDIRAGSVVRHAPDFDTVERSDLRNFLGRPSEANGYADIIKENYDNYDGFVVLRTVSNMPFVASMLAFALEGLNKCVAFTGCDVPHSVAHSELRRNYTLALLIAGSSKLSPREVCVVFNDQVHRATRTVLKAAWGESQLFSTPFFPPLATVVGSTVVLGEEMQNEQDEKHNFSSLTSTSTPTPSSATAKDRDNSNSNNRTTPPTKNKKRPLIAHRLDSVDESEIFNLIVTPAMHEPTIMRLVSLSKAKGVVVHAYGGGTIPWSKRATMHAIEEFYKRGAAIIVVSQLTFGTSDLDTYGAAAEVAKYAIAVGDMTASAASAKLRFMLTKGMPRDEIYARFSTPFRGEVSTKGKRSSL